MENWLGISDGISEKSCSASASPAGKLAEHTPQKMGKEVRVLSPASGIKHVTENILLVQVGKLALQNSWLYDNDGYLREGNKWPWFGLLWLRYSVIISVFSYKHTPKKDTAMASMRAFLQYTTIKRSYNV